MTPRHWQADDREMEPVRPEPCDDLPLFIVEDSVPYAPGSDTSRKAAEAMHVQAAKDRRAVLAEYRQALPGGLTADECATRMNRSVLSIRPRVTELFQSEFLEKTAERRANASGLKARVLKAVERSEAAPLG